jgi:hypothetical protein
MEANPFVVSIDQPVWSKKSSCVMQYLAADMPGMHAINFLLHDVLGGGGSASLRYDPQAKTFAQMVLDTPVKVPACWHVA